MVPQDNETRISNLERDTPLGFDQKPWGLNPTKSGILRSGNEDFKAHAVLKQPTWCYIYIYRCIHKESKMERAEEADDL